jgi:hypothetical protein
MAVVSNQIFLRSHCSGLPALPRELILCRSKQGIVWRNDQKIQCQGDEIDWSLMHVLLRHHQIDVHAPLPLPLPALVQVRWGEVGWAHTTGDTPACTQRCTRRWRAASYHQMMCTRSSNIIHTCAIYMLGIVWISSKVPIFIRFRYVVFFCLQNETWFWGCTYSLAVYSTGWRAISAESGRGIVLEADRMEFDAPIDRAPPPLTKTLIVVAVPISCKPIPSHHLRAEI